MKLILENEEVTPTVRLRLEQYGSDVRLYANSRGVERYLLTIESNGDIIKAPLPECSQLKEAGFKFDTAGEIIINDFNI